jgi:hypothetical protein
MLFSRTAHPRAATRFACEDNNECRRSVAIRHHAQVSHPNRLSPVSAGARIASFAKIGALVRALNVQGDPPQGGPGTAITLAWFTPFLAEQVPTAQAFSEGDRPEVTNEVRMERHMLLRLKQQLRFDEIAALPRCPPP